MPIFLVGFMASGKTTVGRVLAGRLGVGFVDTDEQVERRERRSIASIFEQDGEGYFRDREWEALRSTGAEESCVVATGGGAFLGSAPRRWMKRHGLTVWLDVGLDEARRRVPEGSARPLWPARERLELRVLYERRRAVYALAHFRVVASPGGPQELAEQIQARTGPFFR